MRERRRSLDGRQPDLRHPGRTLPRHVFGAPGGRARQHERARARRSRGGQRAGAGGGGSVPEREVHGRAAPPPAPRQDDRAREPRPRARSIRAVGLARLHPAQPDHERRAAASHRGGRRGRGDLQPRHLREGDRRQLRLRRRARSAWRRLDGPGVAVRKDRHPGYPGRCRSAPPGVRGDKQARRVRQPRGVTPPVRRHGRNAGRSAPPVGRSGACQPDDQGSGHPGRHPGDPPADCGGHQRQRHPALRAGCLRADRGGVHRGARGADRAGRRSGRRRQCGQLLRQQDRYGDRCAARLPPIDVGRCPRTAAAAVASRQGGHRQRQARVPAVPGAVQQPALAGAGRARCADATAVVGQHGIEERQLSRRRVRRGVDRARHRQHDTSPDPLGLPGSRARSREPRRRPRRRLRHDAHARRYRHLTASDDRCPARRRHSAVRRRLPEAAGGRRTPKPGDRCHANRAALRSGAAAGVRDGCQGVAHRLAGARQGEAALGARSDAVDRPRRGAVARLAGNHERSARAPAPVRGDPRGRAERRRLTRPAPRHGRVEPRP